jgi:hypothetical protein
MEINIYIILAIIVVLMCMIYYFMTQQENLKNENFRSKDLLRIKAKLNKN